MIKKTLFILLLFSLVRLTSVLVSLRGGFRAEIGEVDILVNATDTLATIGGVTRLDLDVALVAPSSTPRVTHDVVLNTVFDSIANSIDGVVNLRAAA